MKSIGRLVGSIVFVGVLVGGALTGFATSVRPLLGLDLVGGVSVILSGPPGTQKAVMEKALERIRSRVDALGVAEPDISLLGNNFIQVQLPGLGGQGKVGPQTTVSCATSAAGDSLGCFKSQTEAQTAAGTDGKVEQKPGYCATSSSGKDLGCFDNLADADAKAKSESVQRVLQIIGTTAQLEEREVLATLSVSDPSYATTELTPRDASTGAFVTSDPSGNVVAYGDGNGDGQFSDGIDAKYQLGPIEITGADLSKATAVFLTSSQSNTGQSGWEVNFSLNKAGAQKFSDATTRLIGKQLAIVLDGVVQSAPTVQSAITGGSGVITGSFSEAAAKNLAVVLNSGALPVQLTRQQVVTVSPLLGKQSLRQGLVAGLVGLAALMLYLAFYYRLLGLVTWLGMGIWAVLAIGLVSLMGRTIGYALTLAGVAGIIVSLGITADSYIVFYERLKDEVRHGKSLRAAVVPAFNRSWRTIVAADTVTIIAAAVLYLIAVGSVRGFALTLGLATGLDLFVVYFFKRPTVFLISRSPVLTSLRGMGLRSGVAADPQPIAGGER
jgi:preprotein translocase subunit SecD